MKVLTSTITKTANILAVESTNNLVAKSAILLDRLSAIPYYAINADDFKMSRIEGSFTDLDHTKAEFYLDSKKSTELFQMLIDYARTLAETFVDESED